MLRQDRQSDLSLFEYEDLRRKLQSKSEALLILTKELEQTRSQRDSLQTLVKRFTDERMQALTTLGLRESVYEGNLALQLKEVKEENRQLSKEGQELKQRLKESHGDIKVLRDQLNKVKSQDEIVGCHHDDRERLVEQIERTSMKVSQLERDLSSVLDEKEELVGERDSYKNKVQRLNAEMNLLLTGEDKKLIDIDALLMENRYLQERLRHMQEEKSLAMQTLSKYKNLVERKRNKSSSKLWSPVENSLLVTHKQVESLLQKESLSTVNVAELRSLALALLDALRDKNLELSHQKKANRILGNRVTELESRVQGVCSTTLTTVVLDSEVDSETPSFKDVWAENECYDGDAKESVAELDETEAGDNISLAGGSTSAELPSLSESLPSNRSEESSSSSSSLSYISKCEPKWVETCTQEEKIKKSDGKGGPEEELPPHLQKLFRQAMEELSSPYQEQR